MVKDWKLAVKVALNGITCAVPPAAGPARPAAATAAAVPAASKSWRRLMLAEFVPLIVLPSLGHCGPTLKPRRAGSSARRQAVASPRRRLTIDAAGCAVPEQPGRAVGSGSDRS